nr:hypothetical protein [Tanacetum cinerariifolium]
MKSDWAVWDSEDSDFCWAKEIVRSQVVQQMGIQYFNCKEFMLFAKECKKQKRAKYYTYHKEKMLMCKQAEKGVSLQAEQADWLKETDEEIDEQEVEADVVLLLRIRLILPNSCVRWLSVCTWCRPMRKEGCATLDGGNSTWRGRVRVFGTVLVCVRTQERAGGEGRVLAGRVVKGTVGLVRV